jgi:hypothetical protein
VIGRHLERVVRGRLDRPIEGGIRVVGTGEQRDRLSFDVVPATREFADDPRRTLEWHTPDVDP